MNDYDCKPEIVESGLGSQPTSDLSGRILGFGDLIWLWLSMTAQMGMFLLGASFAGNISYAKVLLAIAIGGIVISIILILNGDVGMKYGIGFSAYLEVPFGEKGKKLPSLMRAVMGIFWFGIQTFYAAQAINIATMYLFNYSNWTLWYILFAIIQILFSLGGIEWIKKLEIISGPTLIFLSIWLIYSQVDSITFREFLKTGDNGKLDFWVVVTAILSYWATISLNVSDFTRHAKRNKQDNTFMKRNYKCFIAQIFGINIGMYLFVSVGMLGEYYTGFENPIYMIASTLENIFIILGIVVIIFAQLNTNVTANLYGAGNILCDIFGDRLNFKQAVIIVGLVGVCTMPWYLLDHYLVYLPLVSAFLVPLSGIMIVDYFLIRKTYLDISSFGKQEGKYYYYKGYNLAALVSYIIAGITGIIFLKHSWLISLPLASILYYLFMELIPLNCKDN